MAKTHEHVVQNRETGSLVSSVGSRGWCADVAALMNAQYQTDAYQVVPFSPGSGLVTAEPTGEESRDA